MGVRYMGVGWPAMNLWLGGNNPTNITTLYIYPKLRLRTPRVDGFGKGNQNKKVVISRLVDASHLPLESCCESYQLVGSSFRTWIRYAVSYPTWGQGKSFFGLVEFHRRYDPLLVGGFNPSEKYESNWKSSPSRNEMLKKLKSPPSLLTNWDHPSLNSRLGGVVRKSQNNRQPGSPRRILASKPRTSATEAFFGSSRRP